MQVINFFIHYNLSYTVFNKRKNFKHSFLLYIENQKEKNRKKVINKYMYNIFNNSIQLHRSIKIEQIILINLLTCDIFTTFFSIYI